LDFLNEGFIYEGRENAFFDGDGKPITPAEMLDRVYHEHCRTLGRVFRMRWKLDSGARWLVREAVWKGQDAAMWALFNLYDVELIDEKKDMRWSFFYKYSLSDFRRVTESGGERSHFFGFQTSQKALFTNLIAVAATFLLLYWKAPRGGLLRVVYYNTALSTAALVLAFLLADRCGPWLLILAICGLSRLRDLVFVFIRKVKV
jgi:hypothetical protein